MTKKISACIVCVALLTMFCPAASARDIFEMHCAKRYAERKKCPQDICELKCEKDNQPDCRMACLPKPCPEIPLDTCPDNFCSKMINCSGEESCHYIMAGELPVCGDLSYAGQEVDCCPGLVRRCGVEFFDHTCDMEGKNSVYRLPICMPCGDGICGQFEDGCNCPEDCAYGGEYTGFDYAEHLRLKAEEIQKAEEEAEKRAERNLKKSKKRKKRSSRNK